MRVIGQENSIQIWQELPIPIATMCIVQYFYHYKGYLIFLDKVVLEIVTDMPKTGVIYEFFKVPDAKLKRFVCMGFLLQ